MKILRIRLHPFGGVADRTCDLHDGVNVIEGPNEFGKSTLNNALWHGLFTPSNLPPVGLKKAMGRWYPRPGGDHSRVTLEFESDGQKWTLKKTWGAGASSIIQSNGGAAIAEPAKVQEQLLALVHRNEATWRHVLFVGQAQLAQTMQDLKEQSKEIDDIQPLIAGAAAIPGDISPDKLAAAIDERIKGHFSRWDINTGGPEKGKGIENPFKNGVGPQLAAYYAMETVRRNLKNVRSYEGQVDEVNTKIIGLQAEIEVDREFVTTGRGLKDGLTSRGGFEERIRRLDGEQTALNAVLDDWPGANKVISRMKSELEGVKTTIQALADELKNAKKRAEAVQLKLAHGKLVEAREAWNAEATKLSESKAVSAESLAELKRLEKDISDFRIKIEAQKLSAKIESATPTSVMIVRGTEAPEHLTLTAAEAWEGQAEGKLIVELRDMKISVESGIGDMNALFEELETASQRRSESLEMLGHESLSSAEAADINHQKYVRDEKHKKDLYTAALLGRTEEEWAVEIAALEALPETRSVSTLETKHATAVRNEAKLTFEIQKEQEKIVTWTTEHTDMKTLRTKFLAKNEELNAAKLELDGLPLLPEGFESVTEYLKLLREKERCQSEVENKLSDLRINKAELVGAAPDHTAEELSDDLDTKEREFQRQHAIGQALLRIRAKLKEVVASSGVDDPMQGLATAVAGHFKNLTCDRYDGVKLDGATPVEISGPLVLETALLSQGTLGSLAFATRLAFAELYLDGMEGFLVLDDPFTDMDPARRRAAEQCLGEFAKQRQVLFFTCHPEHRRELEEHAGAKVPTINENRS
jgi:exonuclease SbcC